MQLFALEAAIDRGRRFTVGKRCRQTGAESVQRLDRPLVVVLPMGPDQSFGKTVELRRIEFERLRLIAAGKGGREGRRRLLCFHAIHSGHRNGAHSKGLHGGAP